MKRLSALALLLFLSACGAPARTAPDAAELTRLLNEFLAGASRNDAAVHDRFWSEDLIYTGSAGRRIGKSDILTDVRSAGTTKPEAPITEYTAEDIRIHQYDDAAVVAFRLVGTTVREGKPQVARYLNTGTFIKQAGRWRAVAWQATRMPRPEEEAREEVAAAQAGFHQALLAADIEKLSALTDESFIWTPDSGDPMTRQRLLDDLGSGQLKYSMLETAHLLISVQGDAAVVRGIALLQRAAAPGARAAAREPDTTHFTLTFVNQEGQWKAVAMHSSRS